MFFLKNICISEWATTALPTCGVPRTSFVERFFCGPQGTWFHTLPASCAGMDGRFVRLRSPLSGVPWTSASSQPMCWGPLNYNTVAKLKVISWNLTPSQEKLSNAVIIAFSPRNVAQNCRFICNIVYQKYKVPSIGFQFSLLQIVDHALVRIQRLLT